MLLSFGIMNRTSAVTLLLLTFAALPGFIVTPATVSATPLAFSPPAEETSSITEVKKGMTALAQKDVKTAKRAFNESLKLNPKQIGAILGLAEIAASEKNIVEARKLVDEALIISPDNPAALISLGKLFMYEKKKDEAQKAFEKAAKKRPDSVMAKEVLGDFYLNVNRDPKKAVDLFLAVIKIDPDRVRSRFSLGLAYSALGENKKALAEFKTASTLSPENPFILEALGRLQFFYKEYENALNTFEGLIKIQPKFLKAYIYRGDIYGAKKEYQQAGVEYRRALKVEEKFAFAWVKLGMVSELTKDLKKAETEYMTALEIDPKMAIAYNNLSWMMASRNVRLDEALTWAGKAVALGPRVIHFLDTLGWVHWVRGEKEDALKMLEKAALADPPIPEVNYHLAVVYAETGKKEKARELLKQALDVNSSFGESEKARELLKRLGN